MKTMEELATQDVVTEDLNKQYDDLIAKLQEAKENQQPIDEGILGAIVGGLAGVSIIPKIMSAACHALGVDEKGQLGSLMTSRLVMGVIGAKVGMKI